MSALSPVIEGNTDATDPTTMSQQQAGTIQYLKNKVEETLDNLGGNVNDLLSQVSEDNQTNSQNISDYQTATAMIQTLILAAHIAKLETRLKDIIFISIHNILDGYI